MIDEARPPIASIRSGAELREWYWLKSELVAHARALGVPASGSKPELTECLCAHLDGRPLPPRHSRPPRVGGQVDWSKGPLLTTTVIDVHYRNSQAVRQFMKEKVGPRFRFSNEFMNWMRSHAGRATLGEAADFWRELDRKKREDGYREASLPQNQYAQFSRALATAAPGISAEDIRRIWKVKRSRRGPPVYAPGDEKL